MEAVPASEGAPMPNRLRADRVAVHALANATMCIGPSLYRARGPDLQYATDPILDLDLARRQDEAVPGQRVLASVDGEAQAIVAMTIVVVVEELRHRTELAVAIGIRPSDMFMFINGPYPRRRRNIKSYHRIHHLAFITRQLI